MYLDRKGPNKQSSSHVIKDVDGSTHTMQQILNRDCFNENKS